MIHTTTFSNRKFSLDNLVRQFSQIHFPERHKTRIKNLFSYPVLCGLEQHAENLTNEFIQYSIDKHIPSSHNCIDEAVTQCLSQAEEYNNGRAITNMFSKIIPGRNMIAMDESARHVVAELYSRLRNCIDNNTNNHLLSISKATELIKKYNLTNSMAAVLSKLLTNEQAKIVDCTLEELYHEIVPHTGPVSRLDSRLSSGLADLSLAVLGAPAYALSKATQIIGPQVFNGVAWTAKKFKLHSFSDMISEMGYSLSRVALNPQSLIGMGGAMIADGAARFASKHAENKKILYLSDILQVATSWLIPGFVMYGLRSQVSNTIGKVSNSTTRFDSTANHSLPIDYLSDESGENGCLDTSTNKCVLPGEYDSNNILLCSPNSQWLNPDANFTPVNTIPCTIGAATTPVSPQTTIEADHSPSTLDPCCTSEGIKFKNGEITPLGILCEHGMWNNPESNQRWDGACTENDAQPVVTSQPQQTSFQSSSAQYCNNSCQDKLVNEVYDKVIGPVDQGREDAARQNLINTIKNNEGTACEYDPNKTEWTYPIKGYNFHCLKDGRLHLDTDDPCVGPCRYHRRPFGDRNVREAVGNVGKAISNIRLPSIADVGDTVFNGVDAVSTWLAKGVEKLIIDENPDGSYTVCGHMGFDNNRSADDIVRAPAIVPVCLYDVGEEAVKYLGNFFDLLDTP
ncbi:hypothetical protein GF327_03485 [Candidatus Woesearchaeota archaeon]|nr:hypothetical protein [Candidatus Woesearchaeota archaeon]